MSWIDKVDEIYEKHFKSDFELLRFEEYFCMNGNGMGALRRYSNEILKTQLLNDRGIVTFEISTADKKIEEFVEFELLMNFHLSQKPSKRSHYKRFAYEHQLKFLKENWDKIINDFNLKNYKQTINKIYSM